MLFLIEVWQRLVISVKKKTSKCFSELTINRCIPARAYRGTAPLARYASPFYALTRSSSSWRFVHYSPQPDLRNFVNFWPEMLMVCDTDPENKTTCGEKTFRD